MHTLLLAFRCTLLRTPHGAHTAPHTLLCTRWCPFTTCRWYKPSQCQLFEEAFEEYRPFYEGTKKASNKVGTHVSTWLSVLWLHRPEASGVPFLRIEFC